MAVSESFLTSCRTAIEDDPALATFRTAYGLFDAASRPNKGRYWYLAFSDAQVGLSPAYAVKKVIRETVKSLADATVTPTERESAYRTLAAQYVPDVPSPRDNAEELAELRQLIHEDQGS